MYWTDLAFGIWATLSRLELEYAGLNVGKNKFGLNFFFFGWATNWAQSLNRVGGARGARLGQVWAPGKNLIP